MKRFFFAPGAVERADATKRTDTLGRWLLTAAALLEVAGQVAGFSNQLAEAGKATAIEI